ncbi:hypothetical protein NDU88_001020 [Pleurodeles waltl]|uniref:Uncharacterized protein n=1 Tax=Pleurodeles waltl TaxID=8319 RepID=A0AAV7KNH5_PLEWA|nr:hypothetical protein NDU88_001020 [Pleurodeles waltl]
MPTVSNSRLSGQAKLNVSAHYGQGPMASAYLDMHQEPRMPAIAEPTRGHPHTRRQLQGILAVLQILGVPTRSPEVACSALSSSLTFRICLGRTAEIFTRGLRRRLLGLRNRLPGIRRAGDQL